MMGSDERLVIMLAKVLVRMNEAFNYEDALLHIRRIATQELDRIFGYLENEQ